MKFNQDVNNDKNKTVDYQLFQIGMVNFKNIFFRKQSLENNANYILVSCGVLLGLLSINPPTYFRTLTIIPIVFLVITAIFTIFCIQSLPFVQLGMMDTWKKVKNEELDPSDNDTQIIILTSLEEVIKNNQQNLEKLTKNYHYAFHTFIISILLTAGIIVLDYLIK